MDIIIEEGDLVDIGYTRGYVVLRDCSEVGWPKTMLLCVTDYYDGWKLESVDSAIKAATKKQGFSEEDKFWYVSNAEARGIKIIQPVDTSVLGTVSRILMRECV